MKVPFGYLDRQFADVDRYLRDIRDLIETGDLTLGAPVREFERRFAELSGIPYAVGVGSGTDAIAMSLKVLGVGPGDEVITTPTTFIATVGAIVMTGARPVFVDSEDGFVIDPSKIEAAITPRTKAILPVHYTGNVADMPVIMEIARRRRLLVVEDACQSIMASRDNQPAGSWGETACFSLHPLKNLNVWGDGGVILTRSPETADRLRLYRNHGLVNRDEVATFGINSRLDSLHAVIGNRLLHDVEWITRQRIANADRYDEAFAHMEEFIRIPGRNPAIRHVYHLYMLRVKNRDNLLRHLQEKGIDARIHYPVPVHLQPAAAGLGYKRGDFPVSEADSETIITLPGHQHLTGDEIGYTIESVLSFYERVRQ